MQTLCKGPMMLLLRQWAKARESIDMKRKMKARELFIGFQGRQGVEVGFLTWLTFRPYPLPFASWLVARAQDEQIAFLALPPQSRKNQRASQPSRVEVG